MVGLDKSRRNNTSSDTTFHSPFEVAYQRIARRRNLQRLADLFVEADADGSLLLSMDEFREAMREPSMQRMFSTLGVQPHQSELVFKTMCNLNVQRPQGMELSIEQFMQGLTSLVGADVDGSGKEIELDMLRPTRQAKSKREAWAQINLGDPASDLSVTVPGLKNPQRSSSSDVFQVDRLPPEAIHRAFLASDRAQALHPATAKTRPVHRIAAAAAGAAAPAGLRREEAFVESLLFQEALSLICTVS